MPKLRVQSFSISVDGFGAGPNQGPESPLGVGMALHDWAFTTRTFRQMFGARPVLGHGNYRSPIRGLYMCGAGTHPGGGVTGLPGRNAAREILKRGFGTLQETWLFD